MRLVSGPGFKLDKYLIKLIYRETLAGYIIEIGVNEFTSTVKDQVFVGFNRRWVIHRDGLSI